MNMQFLVVISKSEPYPFNVKMFSFTPPSPVVKLSELSHMPLISEIVMLDFNNFHMFRRYDIFM